MPHGKHSYTLRVQAHRSGKGSNAYDAYMAAAQVFDAEPSRSKRLQWLGDCIAHPSWTPDQRKAFRYAAGLLGAELPADPPGSILADAARWR